MSKRRHSRLHIAVTVTLLLSLVSCATRDKPAPVSSVSVPPRAKSTAPVTTDSYVVQKGETLYSIAFRANLDFRQLANLNNIGAPYVIYPGQRLQLKQKRATKQQVSQAPRSTPTTKKNPDPVVDQPKQQEYVKSKQNVNNPPKATGSYSNKVKGWRWPAQGQLAQGYSTSLHGNKGIDIAGKEGAKVTAAAAGKVVYAGNALRGYGNLVIIKHNEDYLSAYAHNSKILVSEKQQIESGQVIAEMGKTDSESVKLHFEIRYRGKSVNPLKYLPKR